MPDESLMVAWRAAETAAGGPEVVEPIASEAAATPAETPAAETAAPAAKVEPAKADKAQTVAATGDAAELEQLKTLASKLNFKIEGDRVSVAERVALRQEKREAKDRIARLEQELGQKVTEAQKSLDPFIAAKKAWESKDIDAFAKALGHADWNDLQKDALNHFSDPNYKTIQELRKRDEERNQREQAEREQRETEGRTRAQSEAISNYKKSMVEEFSAHTDPLVKAMSVDPMFINMVYAVQDKHYDRDSDTTLSVEEVLDLKSASGRTNREDFEALYKRLHSAFGGSTEAAPAAKKTGKTGTIKREAEVPHVPKNGGNGFMDPKEREYWAQQLKASQD